MGLAFDAIYPEVYPVALELFKKGNKENYYIAAHIFKQFGKKYNFILTLPSNVMCNLRRN
jgi:hypothetical protein